MSSILLISMFLLFKMKYINSFLLDICHFSYFTLFYSLCQNRINFSFK